MTGRVAASGMREMGIADFIPPGRSPIIIFHKPHFSLTYVRAITIFLLSLIWLSWKLEVLASLNHPNIAQIYGVEDRALVMELVEGDSPKGPMAFDDAWKIASQIAASLEYAHEKGMVHRDLKSWTGGSPEN